MTTKQLPTCTSLNVLLRARRGQCTLIPHTLKIPVVGKDDIYCCCCCCWNGTNSVCQTPLHGHWLQSCCTTPPTDTTNGQAHNNSTTNLPHRNARARHLDMSRCWDVADFCPLVVFVAGVRLVEFGSNSLPCGFLPRHTGFGLLPTCKFLTTPLIVLYTESKNVTFSIVMVTLSIVNHFPYFSKHKLQEVCNRRMYVCMGIINPPNTFSVTALRCKT